MKIADAVYVFRPAKLGAKYDTQFSHACSAYNIVITIHSAQKGPKNIVNCTKRRSLPRRLYILYLVGITVAIHAIVFSYGR